MLKGGSGTREIIKRIDIQTVSAHFELAPRSFEAQKKRLAVSLIVRVILSAGAMLIFSVSIEVVSICSEKRIEKTYRFKLTKCPKAKQKFETAKHKPDRPF
jgi:hypothetical protein